jgi:hypothetical protein
MSWILSCYCQQRLPDSQCGFRFINARVLRDVDVQSDRYDIESELLLQAARKGFRIGSVPVASIYEGQASWINPMTDTVRFLRLLIHETFR